MILQAIQIVVSLLLLVAVGYYVTGKSWFGETGSNIFSKFTVSVAVPCYMFYNVINTCPSRTSLLTLFQKLPIPFVTILISFFLGLLLLKLLKVPTAKRGVFLNAVTFSNTVIIGFPVVESLYGSGAAPEAMVYYMANTILFWTIGVFFLKRDNDKTVRLFSLQGLRQIFSPPMIGFGLGVAVVLFNLPLPYFITSPLTMMKQLTTPMAMIFTGSVIQRSGFQTLKLNKEMAAILLTRFVITPILMFFICIPLPISPLTKQVFFVLATMPAMTQLGIVAKESNSDYQFASAAIVITTTVSLIMIPVYMLILG